MKRIAIEVGVALLVLGGICTSASAAEGDGTVRTGFAVLVGFPAQGTETQETPLLVPGSVIALDAKSVEPEDDIRRTILEKSLSYSSVVGKLWDTFRLDPERRLQKSVLSPVEKGKPLLLPVFEESGVRITAELLEADANQASYRVVFRQGEKILADSTANVARGGRAVVGGMDGDAAPYIFVVIEPGTERGGGLPSEKDGGITAPTVVSRVLPKYPPEARDEKLHGTVVLEAVIDQTGRVVEAEVIESPDPRLSEAALTAFRQWVFKPALRRDGTPVKVRTSITFRFQLR